MVTPSDPVHSSSAAISTTSMHLPATSQYATASAAVLEEMRVSVWKLAEFVFSDAIVACLRNVEEEASKENENDNDEGDERNSGTRSAAIAALRDDVWVGVRVVLAWMRSVSGKWWMRRQVVASASELWELIVKLRTLLRKMRDRLTEPSVDRIIVLQEDWTLRGFSPLKDIFSSKRFFETYVAQSGLRLIDICESGGRLKNDYSLRLECVTKEFETAIEDVALFKRIGDLVLYVDPSCKVEEELATSLQEKVCVHGSFSNDDRMKSAVEQTIEVVDGLDSANWLSDTILNADGTDSNSSSSLVLSSLQDRKKHLESFIQMDKSRTQYSASDVKGSILSPRNKPFTRLLFDTNCWVDDFDDIKKIIDSGWLVIVPLVVITELDGLKTGSVTSLAAKSLQALTYLESKLQSSASRPRNLILQTSRGTVLPYLSVRSEDWSSVELLEDTRTEEKVVDENSKACAAALAEVAATLANFSVRNIDDVLLRCCLKNQHIILQRNAAKMTETCLTGADVVVLVTHDVNLRLKARTLGITTCDFGEMQ